MPGDNDRKLVESLAQLGREYRHYQQEHERGRVDGTTRRRLEAKMQRLRERFERLVAHWIQDETLRGAWTKHFHEGGPAPDEPRIAAAPAFKGITETGSKVEVRPTEDGGYDVLVDGRIECHEKVPWHLDPDAIEPIQIGEHTCQEICDAPSDALAALVTYLATSEAEPPWRWSRALIEDGLIDDNFGLTPRGYRLVGKAAPRPLGAAPSPITFGILTADAAQARLFVLHVTHGEYVPTLAPLVEVSQTSQPHRRARDSDLFSDTRPGFRREGPHGPRHAVSDRRERQRREAERRFAARIIKEAVQVWRAHGVTRAILVASPAMLGVLRPVLSRTNDGSKPWSIRELARDLTQLAAPALHDVLAADGLVPPRGRLPPLRPSPGIPI